MRRRLLAFGLAFVLAVLGCVGILSYVDGADDRAVAGKRPVSVLVATALLPAGTTGAQLRTDGQLKTVLMPAHTVPSDALSSILGGLDNLALTADIQPSQLLLRGALGRRQSSTGGLKIPAGKLAVSVPMTTASQVSGYVRPGSEVAVFDTYQPISDSTTPQDAAATKITATRVLLTRTEVLAIGVKKDAADTSSGSTSTLTVTIAVSQEDAERVVQASQTGTW